MYHFGRFIHIDESQPGRGSVAGGRPGKSGKVAAADGETYVTAGEAARMLRVSPKTVSRWADKGLISCMVTLGGHRRFLKAAVESAAREMYGTPSAPAPNGD